MLVRPHPGLRPPLSIANNGEGKNVMAAQYQQNLRCDFLKMSINPLSVRKNGEGCLEANASRRGEVFDHSSTALPFPTINP